MWCLNAQTDLNLPTSHLCDSALQFTYNITAASVSPGTLWSDLTVQEWYLEQAKEVILIEVSTAQMTWVLFSGRFSSSELYIPLSLRHSCRSLQNRTFQQGTQMQGCQAEIHVIEKGYTKSSLWEGAYPTSLWHCMYNSYHMDSMDTQ